MKKVLLIASLLISIIGFAQPVVQRANAINTVDDPNGMNSRSKIIPRYRDTTEANTKYATLDSAGKIIYTRDIKGFWYRQDNPKKWVRVVSDNLLSNNFFYDSTCNCYKIDTASIVNIINNHIGDSSVTSISIVNDSTIRICYGNGTCVNIGIVTNITNINQVSFLNDSTIIVCQIDTTAATSKCDTVGINRQPIFYYFQNGLRVLSGSNIIGLGGNLTENTTILNNSYTLTMRGNVVNNLIVDNTDIGIAISGVTGSGTGVVGGADSGTGMIAGSTLGVGFKASSRDSVAQIISISPSDSSTEKEISRFQRSTSETPVVGMGGYNSFYLSNNGGNVFEGARIGVVATSVTALSESNDMNFSVKNSGVLAQQVRIKASGNLVFYNYDSATRNDGALTKALGTDAAGNVILGTVGSSLPSLANHHFYVGNASSQPVDAGTDITYNAGVLSMNTVGDKFNLGGIDLGGQLNVVGDAFLSGNLINVSNSMTINGAGGTGLSLVTNSSGRTIKISPNSVQTMVFNNGTITLPQALSAYSTGGYDVMVRNQTTGLIEKTTISASITADNGLTASTSTNVQLGGTLTKNTTIDGSTFYLNSTSSSGSVTLNVANTGGGDAVDAQADTGVGLSASSNSGTAINASSTSSKAISASSLPSSTNTVTTVAAFNRFTSGTAATNIGGSIDFYLENSNGSTNLSNQLIWKWTDVTEATRTSQFKITGVLSASTVDVFTANSDGSWQIRPITATAASAITPAEGMMLFVSSTDATFTSIGFWGYQNGAWHAF